MVNVTKIRTLCAEKGIKLVFLIEKLGLKSRTYFQDIEKNGRDIPLDRLELIAETLNTTVEYLTDEEATLVRSQLKAYEEADPCAWESISKAVGIEVSQVANWCKGVSQGYMKHLPALAQLFGVSEDVLIGKTNRGQREKPAVISDELWEKVQNDSFAIEFLEGYCQLNNEQRSEIKIIWKRIIDEQNKD